MEGAGRSAHWRPGCQAAADVAPGESYAAGTHILRCAPCHRMRRTMEEVKSEMATPGRSRPPATAGGSWGARPSVARNAAGLAAAIDPAEPLAPVRPPASGGIPDPLLIRRERRARTLECGEPQLHPRELVADGGAPTRPPLESSEPALERRRLGGGQRAPELSERPRTTMPPSGTSRRGA
jgi:hypothetical protein